MTFPTWSVGEVLTAADMNTVGAICSTSVTSFKNVIINGDFSINQRGLTSSGTTTSGQFGFDRWRFNFSGGTTTYSAQTFTVGNAISGQEPTNFARVVTSGQSAAGDLCIFNQRIEGVRTFAGQTITISFWAKAGAGTPKLALEIEQGFGTGGSPSAVVNAYAGQVTLSTSWTRYQASIAVPSISGKTLGTNNDDYLQINVWTSAGSTWNSRTGTLGIQNITADFWGVQVEAGSVMTFFERRPRQVELALCQRYYYSSYSNGVAINGADTISGHHQAIGVDTASAVLQNGTFAVPMRSTPTVNFYQPRGGVGSGSMRNHSAGGTDVTGVSVAGVNNRGLGYVAKIGSLSLGTFYGMEITADAEL